MYTVVVVVVVDDDDDIIIIIIIIIITCLLLLLLLFFPWGRAFEIAQYSPYYVTVLYMQNGRRLPGLFVLNKRHQALESPSHVHRSSVNKNCGRMYVSVYWAFLACTQMNYEMNFITMHRCTEMYCNVLQTARVHWRVPVLLLLNYFSQREADNWDLVIG